MLPEPPADLNSCARAFYDELREMLALVDPQGVDAERVNVAGTDGDVDVTLPHATVGDWSVRAQVNSGGAIVYAGMAHEHFDPLDEGERPWTSEVVDFIAEVLRGEFEVEIVYRGGTPIKIRHFLVEEDGTRSSVGMTGILTPSALMFWRPTRTEVTRMDFDARG